MYNKQQKELLFKVCLKNHLGKTNKLYCIVINSSNLLHCKLKTRISWYIYMYLIERKKKILAHLNVRFCSHGLKQFLAVTGSD